MIRMAAPYGTCTSVSATFDIYSEVEAEATRLLGSVLVTHQTGPSGKEVQRLYIEEGCDIGSELYLSMLVDRASSRITRPGSKRSNVRNGGVSGIG